MAYNEKNIAGVSDSYTSTICIEVSVSNNVIYATATIKAKSRAWSGYPNCYLSLQIDGSQINGKSVPALDYTGGTYVPGASTETSVSGNATVGNGSHTVTCSWSNPTSGRYPPASGSVSVSVNVSYNPVTYYYVYFNANGGAGAPSTLTKASNQASVTIPSTKPTRTGYVFRCWNTKADGSGTNYYPNTSYTANATITLYAIWDVTTSTVYLNANGGSPDSSFTINSNQESVNIPTAIPTRYEYKFLGWNTKANGSGTLYQAGGTWTKHSDTTLYAIWQYVGGLVRLRINGRWKKYAVYVYRNKAWVRHDAYINTEGNWKKGAPL